MIYIGIDPDTEKSGVAVFDTDDNSLELSTLSFWDLIEELESYIAPIHIVIEGGWLNTKASWHVSPNMRTASKIGGYVGANHQVGKLLAEYCVVNGLSYEVIKPLPLHRGTFRDKDGKEKKKGNNKGKITHDYFVYLTGYNVRKTSNQEERDAAMLVYGRK